MGICEFHGSDSLHFESSNFRSNCCSEAFEPIANMGIRPEVMSSSALACRKCRGNRTQSCQWTSRQRSIVSTSWESGVRLIPSPTPFRSAPLGCYEHRSAVPVDPPRVVRSICLVELSACPLCWIYSQARSHIETTGTLPIATILRLSIDKSVT